MGEVYRARDTRLDRDVAIKVLPSQIALDPDRRARFEREARAVAALTHPNVLAIHDVGAHEGTPYLVTELLEGETLRQRLEDGALTPRKSVEIGVQIAGGLAAAHEKGIVHRDLKPDNVFVTRDGRVKILDFGLAAQLTQDSGDANSPTIAGATGPGVVLGTVGYMSPEQVRGVKVDHRTDIFALGAVLFEMLTGRRAFQRDTAAETMTAILKEDVPELSSTGRQIAPPLDRIVRRCLEKNPDERMQAARDVAIALEAVSGSDVSTPSGALEPATEDLVGVLGDVADRLLRCHRDRENRRGIGILFLDRRLQDGARQLREDAVDTVAHFLRGDVSALLEPERDDDLRDAFSGIRIELIDAADRVDRFLDLVGDLALDLLRRSAG